MHIRMERPFTYDVDAENRPGVTRTLPAGWTGEVDDEVGKLAVDDGSAVDTHPAKGKAPKAPTDKEIVEGLSADDKTAFDKLDEAGKAKFIAEKKAAA